MSVLEAKISETFWVSSVYQRGRNCGTEHVCAICRKWCGGQQEDCWTDTQVEPNIYWCNACDVLLTQVGGRIVFRDTGTRINLHNRCVLND